MHLINPFATAYRELVQFHEAFAPIDKVRIAARIAYASDVMRMVT